MEKQTENKDVNFLGQVGRLHSPEICVTLSTESVFPGQRPNTRSTPERVFFDPQADFFDRCQKLFLPIIDPKV